MSWRRCVTAESYSLAIPDVVVRALAAVHLLAVLASLAADVSPECTTLLWLIVTRSWCSTRRQVASVAGSTLSIGRGGHLIIHEACRSSLIEDGLLATTAPLVPVDETNAPDERQTPGRASHDPNRRNGRGASCEYSVCRSIRLPGLMLIALCTDHGKPLEILVFYRYHQRQFYRRLMRLTACR